MKNINTKKVIAGVAALGLSALLAGSVVAANVGADNFSMNITKDTMFNNGVPAVSVVVGSMAQPVDVVWAGNIAAAIGKKAYTTAGTVGGAVLQDVTVEVGSSSSSTISGDGKLTDDWTIGSTSVTETIDDSDYSLLGDYDVSVDDDIFGDDSINVKESIILKANVSFDDDKDVADLTAAIPKSAIEYALEFNPGINDDTNDSGSPDFKFNLMGKQYTLEDYSSGTMTLVQNKATVPYMVGDTFEIEGYTIEVKTILEKSSEGATYESEMSISKDGSVLATNIYADGDKIFDDYLEIDTEIDTVYNTRVTVISGTSARVKLKSGQVIKDFPNIGDELWKVAFTGSDPVTVITITNDDSDVQWKNEDALRVGDSVELPFGFAKVEFLGLTKEDSKTLTVEDGMLSWTDSSDDDHSIFFYEQDTSDYETGDNYTTSAEIDGKNLYFDFNTTDDLTQADVAESGYFTVQLEDEDGKYLSTTDSWSWDSLAAPTATEKFYFDGDAVEDTATDYVGFTDIIVPLYNDESVKIAYGVYTKEVSDVIEQIAISLKSTATGSINASPVQNWTVGKTYYQIGTDDLNVSTYVGVSDISSITVADEDMDSMFELVVTDSVDTFTAHIDAYTGDLVNTDDSDYDGGLNQVVSASANLDQENSDDLTWAYTAFGTKYMVDGGIFEAEMPESRLYGQIFIGGGISEEMTLNGGELVLTTPGTVVSTEDGMVSAKLVSSNVIGSDATVAMTPAAWNVNTQRLVYLDNEAMVPTGAKIIVGGHLVNSLANGVTNDYLTQAGQYVVGSDATGNVLVAGYTAEDTADAAKELITVIENM